ncbi:FERM, ARHGEF and pleckstrin domain-containing protein 1 [Halotydeus destructor]|nr:FERM, ARHGEF and pleckstrin domain-containing protein 1 [Halotydeus destructor]
MADSLIEGKGTDDNDGMSQAVGGAGTKESLERPGSLFLAVLEKVGPALKELVMMERTFQTDLEIINAWLKEEDTACEPSSLPTDVLSLLFAAIDPLLELHNSYLNGLESKLNSWNLSSDAVKFDCEDFGEVVHPIVEALPLYNVLTERLPFVLERFNANFKYNKLSERICRQFEARRGCYLPFTSSLIKPGYHVNSYLSVFENLLDFIDATNHSQGCIDAIEQVKQHIRASEVTLESLLNTIYFIELQRDLIGMSNIFQQQRKFVRQGCLLKWSKKGYQQRIFFLFNGLLIYCSRSRATGNPFKVHGSLSLGNVVIDETEGRVGPQFCFTIYGGETAVMVASHSDKERQMWIHDIRLASTLKSVGNGLEGPSPFEDLMDKADLVSGGQAGCVDSRTESLPSQQYHQQMRSNTMVHVCWHRNCSIGINEYKAAFSTCLSGYLLRKFKNSSGWQKLWVVFANFCLFFYKSHQELPLASLPLLGYKLSLPLEEENMGKKYVFKLYFKMHVYYFRADSEYSFVRWMDAIRMASAQ